MSHKFNPFCRKFTLLYIFVLLCLAGKSQYNFQGVDKFLATNKKSFGSDYAVLIYKDGKTIYQKETEEFKIKTKALIASSSKWLTAALVMTFVEEGIISLEDKVSTYLPIFETYGKSYITIRQCLSHQTGIEDNQKLVAKILQRKKFESLEEEVNSFAKREIAANPGTSFNYGSIGPNIAGRVLEVVTKKRFDLLMKQRIFTPLNMRNSTFVPEDDAVNPSGGATSTAADYMNFLVMLLDKGTFMGKRVLSEAAVKTMQTIQYNNIPKKFQPPATEGYEYGLGEWIVSVDDKGNSTVVACPGLFGTYPYIDNCRKYAFIVVTQKPMGEQTKLLQQELKKQVDLQIPASCQ